MAKEAKTINIGFDSDAIERIMNLLQKQANEESETKENMKQYYLQHEPFINAELNRIKQLMAKEDPASDRYMELARAFDKVVSIIRFW